MEKQNKLELKLDDVKKLLKKQPLAAGAVAGYIVMVCVLIYYMVAFVQAFIWLDSRVFPVNSLTGSLLVILNGVLFPISTVFDEFNYNNIKKVLLGINYSVLCLMILSYLFHFTGLFLFPVIFSLKVTPFVSLGMICSLARVSEMIICGVPLYGMVLLWNQFFKNTETVKAIMFFRLNHYLDLRDDAQFQYDLHLGHNIETREIATVFEEDRYLHMSDNGVSGAGKSSLVLVGGIKQDLDTRLRNERMQKKIVRKMLREGKIYRCAEADSFNICDFKAYPMYQEEFDDVKKKYRAAGQTILAPDDGMLDKAYQLAKARGVKVNRIDPTILPNGQFKEGFVGFNPLYIPPEQSKKQDIFYCIAANDRASIYQDVMQQLYELDGTGGDPYFTGLNKTANYNMSLLCILTYPFLEGRQANPVDCLRELTNMHPVTVEYEEEVTDKKGNIKRMRKQRLEPSPELLRLLACYRENFSDVVHEQFDDRINTYFIDLFVVNLKSGVEIYDRSLGLRNLIAGFVLNPHIRPILTAPDNNTLVISKAIERGEVTIFNFYQEMGKNNARVFGLFFLLNFDVAVTARPGDENTRIPHFLRVDELPVILHPMVNNVIAIYRKYRVSAEFAFQSLAQMGETELTKFLASILMQSGTQLIFGRTNLQEMEQYSKLAAQHKVNTEQVSYAEGSLWTDQGMTQNVRTSATAENILDEGDLRYRNFAECTLFGTRHGVAMRPVVTRFNFLKDRDYKDQLTGIDEFPLTEIPVFADEEETVPETVSTFERGGITIEHTAVNIGTVSSMPEDIEEPEENNTAPAKKETRNEDENKEWLPFGDSDSEEEDNVPQRSSAFDFVNDVAGRQRGE